jgi:flagellar biosynthesis protein FliQ
VTPAQVSLGAWIAFAELAGPVLVLMLLVGLAAGILQTMTQIRESSLAFILKLVAVAGLTSAAGPVMMRGVDGYAVHVIASIPAILHG